MRLDKFFTLLFLLFFTSISFANAFISEWKQERSSGAMTRLIGSAYDEGNQKKIIGAVHFKIAKGWKIYGKDSSEFGLPPSIKILENKNHLNHKIYWPKSKTFEEKLGDETISYQYYDKEVILPVEINLKKIDKINKFLVEINYGLCKDVCIPANAQFRAIISQEPDLSALKLIQEYFPRKIIPTNLIDENINKKEPPKTNLAWAIILGLIGGAILNIMPCVLPVLSIKLLSVIKHSNATISKIRFSFLSTILGILLCFIIFASFAAIISLSGNALGWGLQFQNPNFLIFLTIVIVLFISNLSGLFDVTFDQMIANFLDRKISQTKEYHNVFMPNFLSGILAVLLATPCSAPFLGSAISFALTQDILTIFIVFIAIGIGFAVPYIILLIAPKLVYLLPKPGKWMNSVKQLMAGFLAITAIWLIYVLSNNLGLIPAFLVAILLVLLLGCFKIKSNFLKLLAIAAIIGATFWVPVQMQKSEKKNKEITQRIWHKFDENEIYNQINKGNIVVIDITANWCLTCKFNKVRVLESKEIMEKLKNNPRIYAMRGDITKPNEEIMAFLRKHNRFAIPFNAVYGPSAKRGLLTNELLTKKELLILIDKAS